ncbi:MAG: D-aminoacyl-tRNA deacylase [Massiliimalia sp.]|jgi:D-tyrosyl-tRNA(Tyr) deacylase
MKAVIQRISRAEITINGTQTRKVGNGLCVLLGVIQGDEKEQAEFLAKKIYELRIFTDENDKMNLSLKDIDGEMLIVSNFTLGADCSHGRRPSYTNAARPEVAEPLYQYFVEQVKALGIKQVQTGEFGADMQIELVNDGPVTIILDTKEIGK